MLCFSTPVLQAMGNDVHEEFDKRRFIRQVPVAPTLASLPSLPCF
jgi:hypothetical protein